MIGLPGTSSGFFVDSASSSLLPIVAVAVAGGGGESM
jgi:hypothetical protein